MKDMSHRIRITAFEPFGGQENNISQIIALRLAEDDDLTPLDISILPVEYQTAMNKVKQFAAYPEPLLLLGQCGGKNIKVEAAALNVGDSHLPDNNNELLNGNRLTPGGPDGLFTAVNVKELVLVMNEAVTTENGVPLDNELPIKNSIDGVDTDCNTKLNINNKFIKTVKSWHAGTYVCNSAYYAALFWRPKKYLSPVFIHIPEGCDENMIYTSVKAAVIYMKKANLNLCTGENNETR